VTTLKQRIKFSAKKQKIGGEQNGNLRTEKYSNRQKKKNQTNPKLTGETQ
jgi:hypothetical protein